MAYSAKKLARLAEQKKAQVKLEKEQRAGKAKLNAIKAKEDLAKQRAKESLKVVEPVKKGKDQRLVATRNVDAMKLKGWKAVVAPKDKHDRVLGVRVNVSDVILMEK